MQHAPPEDDEAVGVGSRFDAQGEVFLQLAVEALLDMAGGDVFAVLAEERRIVDREKHRHRRFVDGDRGQRFRILVVADRIADFESVDADQGADFTAGHCIDLFLAQTFENHQLLDAALLHRHSVAFGQGDVLSGLQLSARHFTHGDTADVGGVFERGDKHLGRALHDGGFRNFVEDGVQQRRDRVRRLIPDMGHPALFGRAVDGFVVKLLLRCSERKHQVENLFVDHFGTAVGLIDLIDYHDGFLAEREGFLEDETGLGHRSFESIDEQQYAVAHVEHTLHLAAEVGVARGVYNVDFTVFVDDGYILREDRDAAFAFQIVVVEDEFSGIFGIVAQHVALHDHLIDQCGFAVIDVGDNGYIAKFLHKGNFRLQR